MLTFPAGLSPIRGGFAPIANTLSGGQSLSGIEQVISTMSDRWAASYTFAVRTDAQVLIARGLLMRLRGRANSLALPAFDLARAPWGRNRYGILQSPRSVRRRQLDDTLYADNTAELRDGLIDAYLVDAAPVQTTALRIRMVKGGTPEVGHQFSIAAKLYAVEDVSLIAGTSSDYEVTIWPWIRVDTPALVKINFTSPVCEVRLASDREGTDAIRSLDRLRSCDLTLNFDEAP